MEIIRKQNGCLLFALFRDCDFWGNISTRTRHTHILREKHTQTHTTQCHEERSHTGNGNETIQETETVTVGAFHFLHSESIFDLTFPLFPTTNSNSRTTTTTNCDEFYDLYFFRLFCINYKFIFLWFPLNSQLQLIHPHTFVRI